MEYDGGYDAAYFFLRLTMHAYFQGAQFSWSRYGAHLVRSVVLTPSIDMLEKRCRFSNGCGSRPKAAQIRVWPIGQLVSWSVGQLTLKVDQRRPKVH